MNQTNIITESPTDFMRYESTNELLPEFLQCQVQGSLKDIQSQIRHLDKDIEALILLRAEKVAVATKLRAMIAPHRKLPVEILSEVFVHCLTEHFEVHLPLSAGGGLPWKLGHVCSLWRQVVLAEPRLWDNISIGWPKVQLESLMPALEAALSRGGNCPLTLAIFPFDIPSDDRFIRDVVLPHVSRITTLNLRISTRSFVEWLSLPSKLFSSLETVTIMTEGHLRFPPITFRLFESISTLRSIDFSGRLPRTFFTKTPFPWSQLTHITFGNELGASAMLRILSRCSNLISCHFDVSNREDDESSTLTGLRLPFLEYLDVISDGYSGIENGFLPHLILPSLKKFGIEIDNSEAIDENLNTTPSAFLALLSRSSCRLEDLVFHHIWSAFMGLFLDELPSLTSIMSENSFLTSSTMKKMARGECAPSLGELMVPVYLTDVDVLLELLEARWSQETNDRTQNAPKATFKPLDTVIISLRDSDNPDHIDYEAIEPLEQRVRLIQEKYGVQGKRVIFNPPQDDPRF